MTAIEELLTRALLLDEPLVPSDIVPPAAIGPLVAPYVPDSTRTAAKTVGRDQTGGMAARDLRTLCETVLDHSTLSFLQGFVTEHLPEPPGARVLGCILQLADDEDGARSWWQYAAGAGDDLASYCLYLQHLMLGDTEAAAWWRRQTRIDTRPAPQTVLHALDDEEPISTFDASFPTVLRVLTHLENAERPRTEVVDAVMHYVPGAVALGYIDHPEFELPLPRPDFAEHITILLAAASAVTSWMEPPPRQTTAPRLPGRPAARGGNR